MSAPASEEAEPATPPSPTPAENARSTALPPWMSYSGWYGVVAILGAYGLSSFGHLDPDSFLYQLLNFTGAIAIAMVSFRKHAWQPLALNLIWAVIAGIALWQMFV